MTTQKKTRIPDDFAVSESVRAWAASKYGARFLPDQFLAEFKDHFEQAGTRWLNWDRTLQTWIRRASPAGEFYRDVYWQQKLRAAKAMEPRAPRTSVAPLAVAGRYVDDQGRPTAGPPSPARSARDVAQAAIERMRQQARRGAA